MRKIMSFVFSILILMILPWPVWALGGGGLNLGSATVTTILAADGLVGAPSYSFTSDSTSGWFFASAGDIRGVAAGVSDIDLTTSGVVVNGSLYLAFGSSGVGTPDVILVRSGAGILSLKNGTNAQELRVYGTTTGPKYLSMKHDGANATISLTGGGTLTVTAALTGNASTATALAANGANCSAGQFPLGVDASGAVESCTALPTTISGTANQIAASAATGAITLSIPSSPTIPGTTTGTFSGPITGTTGTFNGSVQGKL